MHWPSSAPYISVILLNLITLLFSAATTLAYLTPYLPYSLRQWGTPIYNKAFVLVVVLALITGSYNVFAVYSWRNGKFIFAFRTRRRTRRLRQGAFAGGGGGGGAPYVYEWVSPTANSSYAGSWGGKTASGMGFHLAGTSTWGSGMGRRISGVAASETGKETVGGRNGENGKTPTLLALLRQPGYWKVLLLYALAASVPILTVTLPRDIAAKTYWTNICKDHELSAEVLVRNPRPASDNKSHWNVTARVNFYRNGVWQYEMDLLRILREPLSFPEDSGLGSVGGGRNKVGGGGLGAKEKEDNDRLFVFSVRNTSSPAIFFEGGKEELYTHDASFSNPFTNTQHFPDHPYLPFLNSSVIKDIFRQRSIQEEFHAIVLPYNDAPLYGVMPPLLSPAAPIARVIYHLTPSNSQSRFSLTQISTPSTGHLLHELLGNLTTHPTHLSLTSIHTTSYITQKSTHRWRYKHPDILSGINLGRKSDACLPPNPKLSIPLRLKDQIGPAAAMPPAYSTPWTPRDLRNVRMGRNCGVWKVCALPKNPGGSVAPVVVPGEEVKEKDLLGEGAEGEDAGKGEVETDGDVALKTITKRAVSWATAKLGLKRRAAATPTPATTTNGGNGKDIVGSDNWREEVVRTWPVVVGLLAAEVEGWSVCCGRGE